MGSFKIFTTILVIIILGEIPLIAVQMTPISGPIRNNTEAEISINELVLDPDFDDTPTVIINGTSGEFSSIYHSSTGLEDRNYLNLTFDHVANTSLSFRTEESDDFPDCYDFIYVYQDVEWTDNELPLDALMSVNFYSTHTGNFLYDEYVELYCWIIDSSGNWIKIGSTRGFNWDDVQTRNFDFDYLTLREIFDGMIDDGGGQDDLSDELRVAIGISPRIEFYGSGESGPWSYLNGSMTLQLFSLHFETVIGEVDLEYDAYPSIGFGHWRAEYSVNEPDMAIGNDDSVYVIGQISNYETLTVRHCLVKFNPLGSVEWSSTIDNMRGAAVAVRDSNIYTVGWAGAGHDIALVKWNSAGGKIWNTTIDLGGDETPWGLAVCSDGSVIIVGDRRREDIHLGTVFDPFIMKTDSEGEVLWTTIHENMGPGQSEVFVDSDDRIFARRMMPYGGITEWSHSGNLTDWIYDDIVWTIAMKDDYFITSFSSSQLGFFNISKVFKNGTVAWTSSVEKKYGTSWYERVLAEGLTVSKDGNIYVIVKQFRFDVRWILFKFSPMGVQEWNQSILSVHWMNLWSGVYGDIDVEMGNNDLLYVGGLWIQEEDMPTSVAVAIFNPENAPIPLIIPLWLVASGSGIGIIVVAIIIYRKKSI
ncbi:MAG: hypothetical protein ACFFDQ_03495 [Candidatus Thorarchaeota archaeon]